MNPFEQTKDQRIAQLEAEVARLRANQPSLGHDEVITFPSGERYTKERLNHV
jgi:hypothetical protein